MVKYVYAHLKYGAFCLEEVCEHAACFMYYTFTIKIGGNIVLIR